MNYTEEQLTFLRKNSSLPRSLLAARFNKRFATNKSHVAILSTCKRKQFLTGRTGYFKKSQKPWNTGTKGVCKKNSGCFRKGDRPKKWRPVGSERINTGDGCLLIKVAEPNVWKYKHIIIWESKHGNVIKGHLIRFKDHNPLNCTLDNLEEVSRAVHFYLNRNGYTELSGEFKPAMKIIAMIKTKISRLQRQA